VYFAEVKRRIVANDSAENAQYNYAVSGLTSKHSDNI